MQGAIYCGVPAANTAFKIAARSCAPKAGAPAPQPLAAGVRASRRTTRSARRSCASPCRAQARAPVVMSHALGLDLHMWDALAARLASSAPVLRYDHRGHGGSAVPRGPVHDGASSSTTRRG